jgi:hypothetical protein
MMLIPFWMNHIVGIEGLTTTYFHVVPLTQGLKSFGQKLVHIMSNDAYSV